MKTFKLTNEQINKIEKFHPKCKNLYTGAIGGGEIYTFEPTGLGMIVHYFCKCGKKLDLTEDDKW